MKSQEHFLAINMGEKQIKQIPGLTQGIDLFGNKEGGLYFSKEIDFDSKEGFLRSQMLPDKDESEAGLATLNDTPKWIVKANGGLLYLLTDANEVFQKSGGSWTQENVSGNAGNGQGLVEYDDDLYYVQNNTVGKFDGAVWTDSWQNRSNTDTKYGPTIKYIGKFFVGSGNDIDSWDGTTWTQADLVLPVQEVVRTMAVWNDFLVMGCGSGNVYFWDGTSDTYNSILEIPGNRPADALQVFENTLFAIGGRDASIHIFNGSLFEKVAQLPDLRDNAFDLAPATIWSGAVITWQDKIVFLTKISGRKTLRTRSGVWSYTPRENRLNYEFRPSSGQMSSNLVIGALYSDEGAEELYIAYKDANAGSDGVYIDIIDSSSASAGEGNYFVTKQALPAKFAETFLRRIYANITKLDASSVRKVVIGMRREDVLELKTTLNSTTSGDTNFDLKTTNSVANVAVGDMIEIIEGPAAGDVRWVASIATGTPNIITVTDTFTTGTIASQTVAIVYNYQKIGEITGDDDVTTGKLNINLPAYKAWFYVEIRHGEAGTDREELGVSDITLDYIQRPNK
tara:strand:+ start:13646 stop:15346 length:1701 start_codon:yes stop_codon:yes gene_type:complete